ncbi:MAG TPA: MGMT family protein [Solirubrobacteraceae bacterium]|jgi:methylated-DNA-[protein]-cysteine S-methyltransferase|nr:MGMT family protein [Solirubrobacteraceae bacterium]
MLHFETALGTCGLTWSDAGVTGVLLPGMRGLGRQAAREAEAVPESARDAAAAIVALMDGERTDLRWVVLDETGIEPFRRSVYAASRGIPAGATASYGDIARAIGKPDAPRAVGHALGENPFPIVVPCHRVLSSTGALHGFSAPGGIITKRRLLEIERAPGFTQLSLMQA